MADYILIQLQYWLAYLCCAAQYGYASWCQAPWTDDESKQKRQELKQDRQSLKRLVLWLKDYTRKYIPLAVIPV